MAKREHARLRLHLKKWLEKAVLDYGMIRSGDRVLVGVSGGADSLVLLDLLASPMVFIPEFTLVAVHVDLGFAGGEDDSAHIEEEMRRRVEDWVTEKTDIGLVAHGEINRKNPCFLCSRLRRRRIFEIAAARGCNRIAFAHHRDDIIETLLINLFYGREISAMRPIQSIFGGKLHIIRPLAYLPEASIKKYAEERGLAAVPNRCPTSGASRRLYIKELIRALEKDNRQLRHNIWTAMRHVKTEYLL
ncbi:MAG: ATP-binding protein [Pseudomonadota bacterium]|nr:ATP-binding protein [Pseudomonadota bacterium]